MITFSAFADEIGPDLDLQMDVCESQGVRCIDVRGIDGVNVSQMTVAQAREYHKRLGDRGFGVPFIGSPLGKIKLSDDFDAHLELTKHCCDVARAFGTDCIRMFSFYPAEGQDILAHRDEVMRRLERMLEVAEAHDVQLYHENESHIYGSAPEAVKDIFDTLGTDRIKGIFDPANFVTDGFRPYEEAWTKGLAELTHAFHVKDKKPGAPTCVPAGEGDGQFAEIFADLQRRNWSGYMTLEPHMAAAGQFAGFTGPERFLKAVAGLKKMCDAAGLEYQQ